MSNLNPTAPSQPTLDQSYETPGNPVDTEPAERFQATRNAGASETARPGDQRIPTKQSKFVSLTTPPPAPPTPFPKRRSAFANRRAVLHLRSGIQDATPSSLGYGVHGAPPGEESRGFSQSQLDRNQELEGEQMRASGEGDVADTVQAKPGAVGSQADFSSDLDRYGSISQALLHYRSKT